MKSIAILLHFLFLATFSSDNIVITQKHGTRFPQFGYTPVEDKVTRVQFPVEFVIDNKTSEEAHIMRINYRCISGYRTKRLGWWGVALYENKNDTLISTSEQQAIEYIYPKEKKHYMIFTEHTVYDDTLFHRIFKKEIDIMRKNSDPAEKFVNPTVLTPVQIDYLRHMLSKDSLRIDLAHDKSSQWVYIPIDVDKVIPLKINH